MKKGDIVETIVERQIYPNDGIIHIEGRRAKVQKVFLGQTINVRILKSNEKSARVANLGLVKPANYEKEPLCSFSNFCGGCTFPTLPYEMQLELKEREVLDHLENNEVSLIENLGIEGSERRTKYRNKMEYTFGDEEKGGKQSLGMHRKGRHMDIVTVSDCVITHNDFNKIVEAALNFFLEENIPHYNKKEKTGLQRNLIVRWGERTKELLVNLVTTSQMSFDSEKFVNSFSKLELENKIVGITHTINDNIADSVNCESIKTLYGRDYYYEYVLGLKFKVSSFSFFQTNTEAAERLYTQALNFMDNIEGKTVFDLYCGTGTISQIMALKAKKVVGIEIIPEAVEAAQINAEINGLENCEFLCGDVFEVLDSVTEKPDLIVLDPPRAGVLPKALKKIIDYGVKNIIYISCNPLTLGQNLKTFQEEGYEVAKLQVFDNFPYTKHIEVVTILVKK